MDAVGTRALPGRQGGGGSLGAGLLGRAANAPVLVGFALLLTFFVASDIFEVIRGPGGVATLIKFVLYLPMLGMVIWHYRHFMRGVLGAPELAGLALLAGMSVLWSVDKVATIRGVIPLVVTTVFAMTLGAMLSLRGLLAAFAALGVITLAFSLLTIAGFAEARTSPPFIGAWRAAFSHKNGLGGAATAAFLITLGAALVLEGRIRVLFALTAAGFLLLLYKSESASGYLAAALGFGPLVAGALMRRHVLYWAVLYLIGVISLVGIGYFLLASHIAEPFLEMLGRGTTLSGRIPLWALLDDSIRERFWLGYGFGAFWDAESRRVFQIAMAPQISYIPYYSHNGLLETMLHVGAVGTALFMVAYIRITGSTLLVIPRSPQPALLIPYMVIFMTFFLYNITESWIMARENLFWMTFVALATRIGIVARVARQESRRLPAAQRA